MVEIRRCGTPKDDELSVAIYNEVWPWDAIGMPEAESFKAGCIAWFDVLAYVDGSVGGSCFVAVEHDQPSVGFVLMAVLPTHRRRGAGTALYVAVSAWARERKLEALDAICPEDDPESIAFAERRGFVEVERNGVLALDLRGYEPAAIAAPDGIEVTTWAERLELAHGIYDVAVEAFADVPGRPVEGMAPFDHWLEHDMRGAGDRAEAVFLALADDEVVGFAKLSFNSAQPRVVHHDLTGVRRAWRGRGVAGALKRAQVAWAKEAGYERMQTQNEARNEPIRRINERLGYTPAPGEVVMRGPLAG